jgi:hypothetical protein
MSSSQEFLWTICTSDEQERASRLGRERLAAKEYKRDNRLDSEDRVRKIADGYLGEFAFAKFLENDSIDFQYSGDYIAEGYSDEWDFSVGDITIDVKTQVNSFLPKEDWRCEVTFDQISKIVNIYVFAKLHRRRDNDHVALVGWLPSEVFRKQSQLRKSGTVLLQRPVHYSKFDVTIYELYSLSTLSEHLRARPPKGGTANDDEPNT